MNIEKLAENLLYNIDYEYDESHVDIVMTILQQVADEARREAVNKTLDIQNGVIGAACNWLNAQIYVHPYLSRRDAEIDADRVLMEAVERYLGSLQAGQSKKEDGALIGKV